MQITTLDPGALKPCGMEVPLRRLAAVPNPLEAACWHKLWELVTHLQANDSALELWGQIILKELHLRQPAPPDPVRDRAMKAFIESQALHPDPTSKGLQLNRELLRRFPLPPGVCVSVRIDWQDDAPLRDGLPEMHYRFRIIRPGQTLTQDARTHDLVEAERIICKAFAW